MVSIGKMKSGGMKARRSHRGLKPKSRPTASQIPKKVSLRRKRLVVSCSIFFRLSCLAAGIPRLCPDRCKHRRKGRAKFFHAWFSGVFSGVGGDGAGVRPGIFPINRETTPSNKAIFHVGETRKPGGQYHTT